MDEAESWTPRAWDPWVLRAEMKAQKVSVADLSVRTELSTWRLYKYAAVRGGRVPTPKVAALIGDALDLDQAHPLRVGHQEAA